MFKFEDPIIEKAFNDYLYTRDMMECDKDAGPDDLASVSLRYLKQHGRLDKVEMQDGGSAAVKINVNVNGENEPWLLTLENSAMEVPNGESPKETASAALERCIMDASLKRSKAYAALRLAGSGSPLEKNYGLEGEDDKLTPDRAARESVEGFTSYADSFGIPVGTADEIYCDNYRESRFEAAAVLSAAPAVNTRKEELLDSDIRLRIEDAENGDAEGTGSSAAFYRKLQGLFREGEAAGMVKKCMPAASGAVICRVAPEYAELFSGFAEDKGLKCTITEKEADESGFESNAGGGPFEDGIVNKPINEDLSKDGTVRVISNARGDWQKSYANTSELGFSAAMRALAEDINICSRRGLSQRFDSTIGAGAVFMPFGGAKQLSPAQAAAYKLPVESGSTDDCSLAAWGCNPYIYKASPYHGAYLAVVESISKLVASGASFNEVYLSLMAGKGNDGESEGRAMAALLGAFEAEMGLSVPAVQSFTGCSTDAFISYAFTMGQASELCTPDFKGTGHKVVILEPEIEKDEASAYAGLPTPQSLIDVWRKAYEFIVNGKAIAAYAPGTGGIAEAVLKMSLGNGIGFRFAGNNWIEEDDEEALTNEKIFAYSYGSIILEVASDEDLRSRSVKITEIGSTSSGHMIRKADEALNMGELLMLHEGKFESIYPSNADGVMPDASDVNYAARNWHATIYKRTSPKVLIPVLPGAVTEDDIARAVADAGGKPEMLYLPGESAEEVLRSSERLAAAIDGAQIIFLPDGYGKSLELAELTSYVFRNEGVRESISRFLDKKDGLIAGIGAGFKALLDLGLLPDGVIGNEDGPTLTQNMLGAHQSRIVRIRVASNKSPWLRSCRTGEVYSLPISCSEGRFIASDEVLKKLAVNGQIATQYADEKGNASSDIRFNPPGSMLAIEGITSPDGRVFGRMAHADRAGEGLYRNVPGKYFTDMFENAVRYFK